jgi:hypothetical protein
VQPLLTSPLGGSATASTGNNQIYDGETGSEPWIHHAGRCRLKQLPSSP